MATERFSKKKVYEYLKFSINQLEKEYKFDPTNGYAQVEGKGEEANRAYGEYQAFQLAISNLNL